MTTTRRDERAVAVGVRGASGLAGRQRHPATAPSRALRTLLGASTALVMLGLGGCSAESSAPTATAGADADGEVRSRTAAAPFNGRDLSGWRGDTTLWSVADGQIVGRSDTPIPRNEFLFLERPVADFYFSVEVKLTPDERNSGIQFRSQRHEEGYAIGYQADIGKNVWGRLYHERGRGKLDWPDEGEKHVKPGDWNRVEILAVGPHIWTAINGHLSVALNDPAGEREGLIAFQVHQGPPPEVRLRDLQLVDDPEVKLAGMDEAALVAALREAPQ